MNELLQRLLEAEILTPETQAELQTAFEDQLKEAKDAAREDAAADVRAELTEAFVAEKERLVEAVDAKVNDMFTREINELKEDFEAFRDLEAEYAEKLVEAKAAMSDELQVDMAQLVDKLDKFVEIKLTEEIEELREDITHARENEMGRRIFEAVKDEYAQDFHNNDDSAATYADMENRLEAAQAKLEESEQKHADLARVIKMDAILAPLEGTAREVMETVLTNVSTDKLEEGYATFLPRIIRETEETTEKEDTSVLSEGAEVNEDDEAAAEAKRLEEAVIVTGDAEGAESDDDGSQEINEAYAAEMARMKKFAGIE